MQKEWRHAKNTSARACRAYSGGGLSATKVAAARRMRQTGQRRVIKEFAWPHQAGIPERGYREFLVRKSGN